MSRIFYCRVSSGQGSDRSASPKIVTGLKILTMIYGNTSKFTCFDQFLTGLDQSFESPVPNIWPAFPDGEFFYWSTHPIHSLTRQDNLLPGRRVRGPVRGHPQPGDDGDPEGLQGAPGGLRARDCIYDDLSEIFWKIPCKKRLNWQFYTTTLMSN